MELLDDDEAEEGVFTASSVRLLRSDDTVEDEEIIFLGLIQRVSSVAMIVPVVDLPSPTWQFLYLSGDLVSLSCLFFSGILVHT